MTAPAKRALTLLCAPLLAVGLAACGAAAVSTSGFKGEDHAVAQAISNLQSDVTAGDEQKICANDLASAVVARLQGATGGCKQAITGQLAEVDSLELSVESVQVSGATASARVKSVYEGKSRLSTLALQKESGKWKISALG
jgi:copper chaperone CopZ